MAAICSVKANLTPCPVNGEFVPFASSRIFSFDGIIHVIRVSDMKFMVLFEFNKNKPSWNMNSYENPNMISSVHDIIVDIDDITLYGGDKSCTFCCFEKGEYQPILKTYLIGDFDFGLLKSIVNECTAIRDLKLQFEATARDLYFSSIYSILDPTKDINFHEEFDSYSDKKILEASELTFHNNQRAVSRVADEKIASSPKMSKQIDYSRQQIECCYCHLKKATNMDVVFIVHPYVSLNFDSKVICMCITCAENWKEYREKAIRDNQLILVGEINEEICCVCSDMPEELMLCSKCPRSFCMQCLGKILSPARLNKAIKDEDWFCMCCAANLNWEAFLKKDAWKVIKLSNPLNSAVAPKMQFSDDVAGGSLRTDEAVNVENNNEALHSNVTPLPSNRSTRGSKPPEDVSEQHTDDSAESSSRAKRWTDEEVEALNTLMNRHQRVQADILADPDLATLLPDRSISAIQYRLRRLLQIKGGRQLVQLVEDVTACEAVVVAGTPRKSAAAMVIAQPALEEQPVDAKRTKSAKGKQMATAKLCNETTVQLPVASLPASSNLPTAPSRQRKRIPDATSHLSEFFYFGQYVKYYDSVCMAVSRKKPSSDDFCFLCKDGGELIECDSICRESKFPCRKVYHDYCLSYKVPEHIIKWTCPRHFCDVCGSENIQYACKYCPFSICGNCPEAMVEKFGLARYCLMSKPPTSGEFAGIENVIVCQNCINAIEVCKASRELPSKYEIGGTSLVFPGKFCPTGSARTSCFFMDADVETTNETTKKRIKASEKDKSSSRSVNSNWTER